jgi:hypothetical protein
VLDKYFLDEDASLSFQAKGLLAYLLAKPDNWSVYVGDLINRASDGRKAIYSMLKELEAHGYLSREFNRDGRGKILGITYTIFERPQTLGNPPCAQKGDTDETIAGEPYTQNRHTAKRHTAGRYTEKEPLINTISINNNNKEYQQQQRSIGDQKSAPDQAWHEKPVDVESSNSDSLKQIIDYASGKGIDISGDCARDFLNAAASTKRAIEAIDRAAIITLAKIQSGEKIRNPAGLLFKALDFNNGARLDLKNLDSEREKRLAQKEKKYENIYLS